MSVKGSVRVGVCVIYLPVFRLKLCQHNICDNRMGWGSGSGSGLGSVLNSVSNSVSRKITEKICDVFFKLTG